MNAWHSHNVHSLTSVLPDTDPSSPEPEERSRSRHASSEEIICKEMGWTCGFWAESKSSQTSIHVFIPQLCQPILSWRSHCQRKSGPKFWIPNSEAGNISIKKYDKIREVFHGQCFLPGYSSCHSVMPTSILIFWKIIMASCCVCATGKRHYFIKNGLYAGTVEKTHSKSNFSSSSKGHPSKQSLDWKQLWVSAWTWSDHPAVRGGGFQPPKSCRTEPAKKRGSLQR